MALRTTSERMVGASQFLETEAVLRAIIESPHNIVIFALDREYRYLAFNENHFRTIKQIWGVEIHVGLDMLGVIGRDDDRAKARSNFDRALAGESFTVIEEYGDSRIERRLYEDVYSPVRNAAGEIIGLAVYLTDVTEQRRIQLELDRYRSHLEELVDQRTRELEKAHATLMHAQKLESLGVLAGGIAHDFNNLLAIVLAHAELCARHLAEQSEGRTHVAMIREAALEARLLTRQLLSYAGKGEFILQNVDVNCIVQTLTQLLRATVSKGIRLECVLCSEPLVVNGDAAQLRQIVLNLVTNAAEAIGSSPGSILVRTGLMTATPDALRTACFASEKLSGTCAYLEVEDTGPGIGDDVRGKLFDPFYTTKFTGRGLGLAAVLGIVRSHGGAILLEAAPVHGSRFRILLPNADRATVVGPDVHSSKPGLRQGLQTPLVKGFVLVVDDEETVRAATAQILRGMGYSVFEADSGARACGLLRQHYGEIDLVLLDFAMPDMNGQQTFQELKKIQPELPILLLTAYAETEFGRRFQPGDLAGFVIKPFTGEELAAAIAACPSLSHRNSPHAQVRNQVDSREH